MTFEATLDKRQATKGERTRARVLSAARAMIEDMDIAAISQQAVAERAGITQSALRHHFPTKDGMFDALFEEVFSGFYRSAEKILLEPGLAPRACLMKLCRLHLGYVTSESDKVALKSFAHYLYNPDLLARQSAWYQWIVGHYANLLALMRPELDRATCNARALAILTLCIGAWVTMGRSRPELSASEDGTPDDALLAAIAHLVDQ